MSALPPHDPLTALWQSAAKPDIQHLLAGFQRSNRLHQRLNRSVLAILSGVSVLLIFEEATGRIGSHGILSALWIFVLVSGARWQRRASCSRSDAFTLNTVSLLRLMIARAKSDLLVARCLYAGVPFGAGAGFLVARLAGFSARAGVNAVHPQLHMVQTSAGVAALILMVATGAILARSRSLQVRELSGKLEAITAEL